MTDTKHNKTTQGKKTGRPRKGTLEYRRGSWHARLTVTVEGESLRRWFNLETQNKAVARRKMARLAAENQSPSVEALREEAARVETYAELAERVHATRVADGIKDAEGEKQREAMHILPELGNRQITSITHEDLSDLLLAMRDKGKAKATIRHARQILNSRFDRARREGSLHENPVALCTMPRAKKDNRERAVLTDSELVTYLAWQHPLPRHQIATVQRQVMACLSRMFGGLRTGDLHALDWSALDVSGGFRFGWAPRKKTARPQKLIVPEMLRPIICDWWERQGRPIAGLIFPALRGENAGVGAKKGVSHADAFRRDLKRAFGLELAVTRKKVEADGSITLVIDKWIDNPKRKMTPREVELFEETEHTRPVDFHSWRRAFVQALADAEVNAQQAAALAGHSSLQAHAMYLNSTAKARELPAGALPNLRVATVNDDLPPRSFAPTSAKTSWPAVMANSETRVLVAPEVGLEPTTSGLTVRCSAN